MSNYSEGPKYLDPKITQPQRFRIKNGVFLSNDGEIELHAIGWDRFHCKKCGKITIHDIFLEIAADLIVIKMKPITTCRDCEHEERGEITDAGNVQNEIKNLTSGHRTKQETGTRPISESRKKKG